MRGNSMGNYLQNQVMSASPAELILMLYEEGVRTLNKVELAFNNENPGRFEVINNGILHAQDVVVELTVALDLEKGGELSANLQGLYQFMMDHLCLANAEKIKQPVIEVRELMTEMRDTWRKVVEMANAGEVEEEPARPDGGPAAGQSRVWAAG